MKPPRYDSLRIARRLRSRPWDDAVILDADDVRRTVKPPAVAEMILSVVANSGCYLGSYEYRRAEDAA